MFQRLAETETRVDCNPGQGNARGFGGSDPLGEKLGDLDDDISVARIVLHAARFALHVHQAYARLAGGGDLQGAGCAQRVDVVDHVGTGVHRNAHDFRLDGIDRQGRTATVQGFDHRQQAVDFLLRRHGRRAGSRGFGAEIENVGPLLQQAKSLRHGGIGVAVQAVTRKGIIGQIDNAHDERALGVEDKSPAMKILCHEKSGPPNRQVFGGPLRQESVRPAPVPSARGPARCRRGARVARWKAWADAAAGRP